MKKFLSIFLFLFISIDVLAAKDQINSNSVKALRQAQECYDKLEYGKALKYAEDAILYRKQESEYELKVLYNALSAKKVAAAGIDINEVLKVLEERGEKESIEIITYYIKVKGIDFFDSSIENLRSYIQKIKDYPEAYKIIGDIYKLEGEYDFAENYYKMALDHAEILDIPNEKYEILYMLAQISKLNGDISAMETRLLNILIDDPFYKDNALFNSMMGTIKSNNNKSMEKFFTLYRASSYYCLNTYNELVQYYLDQGEKEKALRLSALSVLTGYTKIYTILKDRNPEYEYENLSTFFQELSFYNDVIEWGKNNNVWKDFNDFANICSQCGYTVIARDLLKVLVQFSPDTYWQKNAVLLLENLD